MNKFRVIKSIIWIFIIIGIYVNIHYKDLKNTPLENQTIIKVEKGDNLTNLLVQKLNYDSFYLKLYLKLNTIDDDINLQVGEYTLEKGDKLESILKTFKNGPKTQNQIITILEGRNIYDIDTCLSNPQSKMTTSSDGKQDGCLYFFDDKKQKVFITKPLINPGDFAKEAKNISKYKNNYTFLENAITLEGFLYPDTYYINQNNFDLEKLTTNMLDNFKNKVYKKDLAGKNPKEILEIINLASIVEKEEKNPYNKKIVAGILLKRYQENWMIGADITACYNFSLNSEQCKMNLSNYIYDKNDYNTRTKVGLPKTPISNPQINTIQAVINPEQTDYYYYLHNTTTGEIYFARNAQEHETNKKYLVK